MDSNVYIVGIGVSVPAGLPMLDCFLAAARHHLEYSQSGLGSQSEDSRNESEALRSVLEYAQSRSKDLAARNQSPENVEHVFGILREERSNPSLNRKRHKQLADVDRDLVYTIIRTCELCEQQRRLCRPVVCLPGGIERCTLYAGFARSLQECDTVISFNYDLLLEQGFVSMGLKPDYWLPKQVKPIGECWPNDWPKRAFLKLHGSANWMVCQNNSCQYIHVHTDVFNNTSGHVFDKLCQDCNKNVGLRFIMVPPVPRKRIRPPRKEDTALRRILKAAIERVRAAARVFVIGYSCPPSDESGSAFVELLTRGLKANPNGPEVIIVNPNEEHAERVQCAIKRHVPTTDPRIVTATCYSRDWGKFESFIESKEGRALMGRERGWV